MKKDDKDLNRKVRISVSIGMDLNDYFTEVSKDLGFTKSMIITELLKESLYNMRENKEYSNVVKSLEYRKEQLGLIGKELE